MIVLLLILLPMAGGLLAGTLGAKKPALCRSITILTLALELVLALSLPMLKDQMLVLKDFCGIGLSFQTSGLTVLLALLAAILWMVSGLVGLEDLEGDAKSWRYHLFLLLTLGAIQGVFLSGDFYTTLVFFEIMSVTSYVLVLHNGSDAAKEASNSYLSYAVIGGLVSLMGLFLLYSLLGTLRFDQLPAAVAEYQAISDAPEHMMWLYGAGGLTLMTFAAKVCMWPVHTWLPGSYTQAPAPATALLSGIITKAGIFGICGITAKLLLHDAVFGEMLLLFGIATALWGGFMALCQTNLKTIFAYSSMSQIGFILVGLGMQGVLGEENAMAVWGSVLHLTNHAWIKLILFIAAGLVFRTLGELELDQIRGFGRKKPQLLVIFLMPALGVMGVPMWNGYISKTLIHESIVEYIHHGAEHGLDVGMYQVIEWLFLIAGGMTVAYMTKILVCLFVEKNADPKRQKRLEETPVKASKLTMMVMTVCAVLCPVLGLTPHLTLEGIAKYTQDFFRTQGVEHTVHYFSLVNLKGALISLVIGAVLYFGFIRVFVRRNKMTGVTYQNPWSQKLSLEKMIYRPLLLVILPFIGAVFGRLVSSLFPWLVKLANKILFFKAKPTVTPGEDPLFAAYDPHPAGRRGSTGTLGYGLTLFGLGYMAMMIYIILRFYLG